MPRTKNQPTPMRATKGFPVEYSSPLRSWHHVASKTISRNRSGIAAVSASTSASEAVGPSVARSVRPPTTLAARGGDECVPAIGVGPGSLG
jgi:hypothetical protein